jgi:hypothetical protein
LVLYLKKHVVTVLHKKAWARNGISLSHVPIGGMEWG